MNQIKPHLVWVGHAGDGRAFRDIFAAGIRAIVQLAIEEQPIQAPRDIVYLRFPLLDGEGNDPDLLRLAIDAVVALISKRIPVLVCCGAGMSRSPAIVAAGLAIISGSALEDRLWDIVADHPADVSPALLADVRAILMGLS